MCSLFWILVALCLWLTYMLIRAVRRDLQRRDREIDFIINITHPDNRDDDQMRRILQDYLNETLE